MFVIVDSFPTPNTLTFHFNIPILVDHYPDKKLTYFSLPNQMNGNLQHNELHAKHLIHNASVQETGTLNDSDKKY